MTAIMPKSAWVGPLISCLIATSAFACRYSVRDVGFVEMGDPPYRLIVIVRDDTPAEWVKVCERASYSALLDSNVRFSMANPDRQKDHEVTRHIDPRQQLSSPAAILLSPQGGSLRLAPPPAANDDTATASWLESAVVSPTRIELIRATVEAYCAILLIEGDVASENRKAEEAIGAAIEETHKAMGNLPKPITNPPQLVRVSASHRPRENVLLWSLGADASAIAQPSATVIYGRGRRIGPVFKASAITQASLLGVVSLVGESCECGLDRQQMLGAMVPLRWEDAVRARATRILGFDPENPMVRTEVAQILSMGQGRPTSQQGRDELELMGYSEQVIEFRSDSNDAATNGNPAERDGATTPTETQPEASESKPAPSALEAAGEVRTLPAVDGKSRQAQPSVSSVWWVGGSLAIAILVGGVFIILWAQRRAA